MHRIMYYLAFLAGSSTDSGTKTSGSCHRSPEVGERGEEANGDGPPIACCTEGEGVAGWGRGAAGVTHDPGESFSHNQGIPEEAI